MNITWLLERLWGGLWLWWRPLLGWWRLLLCRRLERSLLLDKLVSLEGLWSKHHQLRYRLGGSAAHSGQYWIAMGNGGGADLLMVRCCQENYDSF